MANLITTLTSITSFCASMVGTWVTTIFAQGNEVIQLFVLVPLVGIGIGALKRLMSA